jgi:hypothetical protein
VCQSISSSLDSLLDFKSNLASVVCLKIAFQCTGGPSRLQLQPHLPPIFLFCHHSSTPSIPCFGPQSDSGVSVISVCNSKAKLLKTNIRRHKSRSCVRRSMVPPATTSGSRTSLVKHHSVMCVLTLLSVQVSLKTHPSTP